MKKKIVLLVCMLMLSVGLLSGCVEQAKGKYMFLDCSLEVEWKNVDVIQKCFITFYKPGNYTFRFDPDEFVNNHCCGEYIYCVTESMIRYCGYEISLKPSSKLSDVCVYVSDGNNDECYRFTS